MSEQLASQLGNVKIYQGLPQNFDMVHSHDVVVLDDLMLEAVNSSIVTHLFTKLLHHRQIFLVNITQNMFAKGKDNRTRSLNTHYMVIMKNPRDASQIDVLARQMKINYLQQAYHEATDNSPHSYLLMDFHQDTPDEIRVRSRILPHESPHAAHMTAEMAEKAINKRH
jgi:hypothetical protein